MENQKIADLLFPNLTLTESEVFAKYPKRRLKEGNGRCEKILKFLKKR